MDVLIEGVLTGELGKDTFLLPNWWIYIWFENKESNKLGIIHLIRKQNFRRNLHVLLSDTRTYLSVSVVRHVNFSENLGSALNGLSL